MRIEVVTLFPEFVAQAVRVGVLGRASLRRTSIARSTIDRTAAGREWC